MSRSYEYGFRRLYRIIFTGVAQLVRVPDLGSGGREFESRHLDQRPVFETKYKRTAWGRHRLERILKGSCRSLKIIFERGFENGASRS